MKYLWAAVISVALGFLNISQGFADDLVDIQGKKELTVGILLENPPFGTALPDGAVEGLDIDVANLIAKDLGVEANIVPTADSNRVADVIARKIDLAIATLSINAERAKVVQFSMPYNVIDNIIVGKEDLDIKSVEDLKGKTIGVAQGTSAESLLKEVAPKDTVILSFDGRAANLQALVSGQIEMLADDNLVLTVLESAVGPGYESKLILGSTWIGVGMRPGEENLLTAVNNAIAKARTDGTLAAIHQKWLKRDLPEWPAEAGGVTFPK